MGRLLTIKTNMQWPLGQVFEIPDQYNGHQRGTFYYRNAHGECCGPFHNYDAAQWDLHQHLAGLNRV